MTTGHPPGCDCCTGLADKTPLELDNRPGLPQIAYRAGTYGHFRASMLAGLTRASLALALAGLKTRDPSDFSVGLIDAWAVAADVLTFYTERIANEHYLGTATERRSIGDMVALIGYQLNPGVAAQAWLAFTLETAPGSPPASAIPLGAKVQTLPGPNEVPQTFETVEPLEAVAAWNRPALRVLEPHTPRSGEQQVRLAGVGLNLRRGDQLIFVADDWSTSDPANRWQRVRVTRVSQIPEEQITVVDFSPGLAGLDFVDGVGVRVFAVRGTAALFGFSAPDPRLFDPEIRGELGTALNNDETEWNFAGVVFSEIFLDSIYEGIEPGSWVVLTNAGDLLNPLEELAAVVSVREAAKSAYALSARVSVLELDRTDAVLTAFAGTSTRSSIVHLRSEELTLAPNPIVEPLYGQHIPLAEPVPASPAVRRILIRGKSPRAAESADTPFDDPPPWPAGETPRVLSIEDELEGLPGKVRWTLRPESGDDFTAIGPPDALTYVPSLAPDELVGEVALVASSLGESQTDVLTLTAPLTNVYDRQADTPIEIYGNVADATHGETVAQEILGSGDGARPFQRFTLRKPPLTYVPAPTVTGGSSTLEIRVNGLRWPEAATLFGTEKRDRVYVASTGDDGKTTVMFGDGEAGARLPTGIDNIVASYRAGLGLAGMARADQLTLPMTRPLGLKAVTNPLPASGAADPQAAEDARENAPRSVLTLGRVVSLQDYADFASDYAGVGKATATWTWDGARRGVVLTVAAADGKPLPAGSTLLSNLRASLLSIGSTRVGLEIRDHQPAYFRLLATLRVAADYQADIVRDAVSARILSLYSFDARTFGQGVGLSEMASIIHSIAGLEAVRIDQLHLDTDPPSASVFLPAAVPIPGAPPGAPAAEILTVAPDGVVLEVGW